MSEELIKGLKKLQTTTNGLLKSLQSYVKSPSPVVAAGWLKQANKQCQRLKEGINLIASLEDYLKAEIAKNQVEQRAYFNKIGSRLSEFMPQLQVSGQLPLLKVGLLTLEFAVDKGQVKVWYGPKYELLATVNLFKEDLIAVIRQIYERLQSQGVKNESLLAVLYRAYNHYLKEQDLAMEEPLPLKELFRYIIWEVQKDDFWQCPSKTNFYEYPRYQFSFDLFSTSQRRYQNWELKLIVATREQTHHPRDYLWVPLNLQGDGHCFAALKFRQVG